MSGPNVAYIFGAAGDGFEQILSDTLGIGTYTLTVSVGTRNEGGGVSFGGYRVDLLGDGGSTVLASTSKLDSWFSQLFYRCLINV